MSCRVQRGVLSVTPSSLKVWRECLRNLIWEHDGFEGEVGGWAFEHGCLIQELAG